MKGIVFPSSNNSTTAWIWWRLTSSPRAMCRKSMVTVLAIVRKGPTVGETQDRRSAFMSSKRLAGKNAIVPQKDQTRNMPIADTRDAEAWQGPSAAAQPPVTRNPRGDS